MFHLPSEPKVFRKRHSGEDTGATLLHPRPAAPLQNSLTPSLLLLTQLSSSGSLTNGYRVVVLSLQRKSSKGVRSAWLLGTLHQNGTAI